MPPVLSGSGVLDRGSFSQGRLSLPLIPGDTNSVSEPPPIPDSDKRALQRLVSLGVPQDELPSVIGSIVSNVKATDIVKCLQSSDAQTFIDIVDEACYHTTPSMRNRLLTSVLPFYSCRPGVRWTRFRTTSQKEMCEIIIQDVCRPRHTS